ncbi:MAG: hypothetical protein WCK67_10130 [bacterium]
MTESLKNFRCLSCGYIVVAYEMPDVCPDCRSERFKIIDIEDK